MQQGWVEDRLKKLLPGNQWFLVWLPLRLAKHHNDDSPPIIHRDFDAYQGPGTRDDPIFTSGYIEQTAGLLPMLHSLESVRVWHLAAGQEPEQLAQVAFRRDMLFARCAARGSSCAA
jgi:hypothetical protein